MRSFGIQYTVVPFLARAKKVKSTGHDPAVICIAFRLLDAPFISLFCMSDPSLLEVVDSSLGGEGTRIMCFF
jgi:hypothetical protein